MSLNLLNGIKFKQRERTLSCSSCRQSTGVPQTRINLKVPRAYTSSSRGKEKGRGQITVQLFGGGGGEFALNV